jgi:riboflavin synthase
MFTGIIEAVGRLGARASHGGDIQLTIATGRLDLSDVKTGDSICVSGVCLTVIELNETGFVTDVSAETMARTTLGDRVAGDALNLERALTPTTRLGGHLVSGHVDGIGHVTQFYQDARSWRLHIRAPAALARYIAEKGSICVDGISLTVNGVSGAEFDLNIIPHTLQETTIADYQVGRAVNLEVDLIARYVERLLLGDNAATASSGLSEQQLRDSGFIKAN